MHRGADSDQRRVESGRHPAGPPPYVGRRSELRRARTALREAGSVVVTGVAGSGRTRFARELAEQTGVGRPVRWTTGSRSAGGIQLGALAALIPPITGNGGELALVQHALGALSAPAASGSPLLIVDDAHLLDPLSLTVVQHLASNRSADVVVTACDGYPDATTSLWKDGFSRRIALDPLAPDETEQLISMTLGGHLDSRTAHGLQVLSEGLPLPLIELLRGVVDSGAVMTRGAVRWLRGNLAVPRRLTELVVARLDDLDSQERHVLEVVCTAGRLPIDRLVDLVDPLVLEKVEQRGLLRVDVTGDVTAAHALDQAVVRARLPHSRTERLRAIARSASPDREQDPLTAARQHLSDGDPVRARAVATSLEGGVGIVAEAASWLLPELPDQAATHGDPLPILSASRASGRDRPHQGADEGAARLAAGRTALFELVAGRTAGVAATVARERALLDLPVHGVRTQAIAARLMLDAAAVVGLVLEGRLGEAVDAARHQHNAQLDRPRSAADPMTAFVLGCAQLAAGMVDLAARHLDEAADGWERADPLAVAGSGAALRAIAHAQRADPSSAHAALAVARRSRRCPLMLGLLAASWTHSAGGNRDGGAALALRAAAATRRQAASVWEATALHAVVRFGAPSRASARLAQLCTEIRSPLVATMARHADAARTGDTDALDDVAERFERQGALLLAAEVLATRSRGRHGRDASAASLRAAVLTRRCGHVRTPALEELPSTALTRREGEIVRLAAAGLNNRAIATELVLSVRTVETHLANAYPKLGVEGRGELRGMMPEVAGPAEPC